MTSATSPAVSAPVELSGQSADVLRRAPDGGWRVLIDDPVLAKASQRWNELLYDRFVAAGYANVRPSYGSVLVPPFEEDGLRMVELAARARLSKQTAAFARWWRRRSPSSMGWSSGG